MAPGASVINVAQFRPLMGMSRTCCDPITPLISAEVLVTASAVAVTLNNPSEAIWLFRAIASPNPAADHGVADHLRRGLARVGRG